ncbi:hypothetical protein AB0H69_22975 [Streptomyces phaeochromogenes]|uniref:hypothetical protein n=1 Tax=Streptomyces phaeochromogenes TaxID=1923 RepID=UPI0033DC7253
MSIYSELISGAWRDYLTTPQNAAPDCRGFLNTGREILLERVTTALTIDCCRAHTSLLSEIRDFAGGHENSRVLNAKIRQHEIAIQSSTSKRHLAQVLGVIQNKGFPILANIFVMPQLSDGVVRVHLTQPSSCRVAESGNTDYGAGQEVGKIAATLSSSLLETPTLRTPENWMHVKRLPRSAASGVDWSAWSIGLFGTFLEEVVWASSRYLDALDRVWDLSSLAGLQAWAVARLCSATRTVRSISAVLDSDRSVQKLAKAIRIISPRLYDSVALCGNDHPELTFSLARRVRQGMSDAVRESWAGDGPGYSYSLSKIDSVKIRYSSPAHSRDLSVAATVIEALEQEATWVYSDVLRCIQCGDFPPAIRAGTVGGHYMPSQNMVTVSSGLPSVIYSAWQSDAFILGSVGGVIGHEIAHALDAGNWGFGGIESDRKTGVPPFALDHVVNRLIEHAKQDVRKGLVSSFSPADCRNELLADYLSLSAGVYAMGRERAKDREFRDFFLGWSGLWDTADEGHAVPYPSDLYRILMVRHFDQFYRAFKCDPSSPIWISREDRVRL